MLFLPVLICFAPPDAESLMAEVERRNQAPAFQYTGEVTVERPGEPRESKRWTYQRTGPPGRSRVLLRFLAPAELRGVALLVWNEPKAPAGIWLYTPASGRTRRIAPQDRWGRIAGTDLAFEDLEDRSREHWIYSDLTSVPLDGEPCWRVRATPRQAAAEGTFTWLWISQEKWTPLRAEKWSGGRAAVRTVFEDLRLQGAWWTPYRITTSDLQQGSRTTLRLTSASYPAGLPRSAFTLEALKGDW